MGDAPRIQERHVDVRYAIAAAISAGRRLPNILRRQSANGQDLRLGRSQLRPISFAHPEVPEERAVERSLFVTHKNGAKLPPRQRS
jgi:hypothetical protein